MEKRTEIVKILIATGTDVTKKLQQVTRPFALCVTLSLKENHRYTELQHFGNVPIVKMLLEAGADPSMKDANGDTPISWGSWHLREADILHLLVFEGISGIYHYWNKGIMIAGLLLMFTRLPDLLFEMKTGQKLKFGNMPRRPNDIVCTIFGWLTLPLIWYSLCSLK